MNTLAVVHARALLGLSAPPVSVEVHLANGLPAFSIVGLPKTSVVVTYMSGDDALRPRRVQCQ